MPPSSDAVAVVLDAAGFRLAMAEAVAEVLHQAEGLRDAMSDKLAVSEEEAAAMIGLHVHQLRDERRRGRIASSSITGRRVRYQRGDLLAYLARQRTEATR